MQLNEFPGNSHNERQSNEKKPEPNFEPVVTGPVIRQRKGFGKRMTDLFFGNSDGTGVVEYVVRDILAPGLKQLAFDFFTAGMQRALYGDSRPYQQTSPYRPGMPPSPTRTHISYNQPVVRHPGMPPQGPVTHRPGPPGYSSGYEFLEVILATQAEADIVASRMYDALRDYQMVSVANLNRFLNQSTTNYTDNDWGWTDLTGTAVRKVRNGWQLILPEPRPLPKS